MHRKTLLASALAVLMAGSASLVLAQTTPTAPTTTTSSSSSTQTTKMMKGHNNRHGDWRGHGMRSAGHDRQHGGVIGDMRALERLYMQSGRSKDLTALYNEVLTKSQDPRVRDYTYRRLARLQAQPANVDQAIATLRKGLDESLANEAKMRTQHEAMRANWQQHQSNMKTPVPVQPAAAQ
ncbi:MAG: hypothetical protein ABI114_13270 [Rhodanobacter sp.]